MQSFFSDKTLLLAMVEDLERSRIDPVKKYSKILEWALDLEQLAETIEFHFCTQEQLPARGAHVEYKVYINIYIYIHTYKYVCVQARDYVY